MVTPKMTPTLMSLIKTGYLLSSNVIEAYLDLFIVKRAKTTHNKSLLILYNEISLDKKDFAAKGYNHSNILIRSGNFFFDYECLAHAI